MCVARHVLFGGPASSRHLAVLCGWGGGKLKNVHKYASFWHRLGWRTATVEMTMDMTFFPASQTAAADVARSIARECREQRVAHGDEARIVAHSFSNGGTFMKLAVLEEGGVSFDGAVYDSAPSLSTRFLPLGAPFVIASSGGSFGARLREATRHLPYALAATVAAPWSDRPPPLGLFRKLFSAETNVPRPELFVYSADDALIPSHMVERFIERRRMHGSAPVQVLGPLACSPHCSHGKTHPLDYAAAVARFAAVVVEAPRVHAGAVTRESEYGV